MLSTEDTFKIKPHKWVESKRRKKTYHKKSTWKHGFSSAILVSDNLYNVFLDRIQANQIYRCIKIIMHHDQVESTQEWKIGITS